MLPPFLHAVGQQGESPREVVLSELGAVAQASLYRRV